MTVTGIATQESTATATNAVKIHHYSSSTGSADIFKASTDGSCHVAYYGVLWYGFLLRF